ncbi:hypothetical protein CPB84DRAFT_1826074 [Gymnopilus junonius]|uniref:Fe2OG dioxygenase domain-containing protein n=1 Tax=Gymnopilus junonius TaxID=109634 RepID=A0A9P5TM60_GYMJU|nr:hypothetical protein CPB84DRAFT_1826074 [Gymnopilus junonius]
MSGVTLDNLPTYTAVKAAFETISELPFCSGTVPLDPTNAALFFRSGDGAGTYRVVNFLDTNEDQLSSLVNACQPATFGVDKKDVLDESYRKAVKMDSVDFAAQFSPVTSGVLKAVCEELLQRSADQEPVQIELYKLNVYGPGSFFKAHVDTPRSDKMFGSLVVVLPTVHAGGSLIFHHRGQEHTFDTAQAIFSQESPQVAFVAFYSDIEHGVSVVSSGYRITLTYNLYFSEQPSARTAFGIVPEQDPLLQMKQALSALIDDPQFLPQGGLIGFGLSHKSLGLSVSLKVFYSNQTIGQEATRYCLLDFFADLQCAMEIEGDVMDYFQDSCDGTIVYDAGDPSVEHAEGKPIVWIKPLCESNSFQQPFVAYGNEASIHFAWGDVCLVVRIGVEDEENSESE